MRKSIGWRFPDFCFVFQVVLLLIFISDSAFAEDPFEANKTWFIMGQDTGTLSSFKEEVLDKDPKFPRPDGSTIYTNLVIDDKNMAPLQGFLQTANYGSGRNSLKKQLRDYPGALAVGLWLKDVACDKSVDASLRNTALRAISGDPTIPANLRATYDRWLDDLIDYLKATKRDVLLRIGYGFDGFWNCYSPEAYKAAFAAIKQRIIERQATNIYTVWQTANWSLLTKDPRMMSTHNSSNPDHLALWYPGDEHVDIIGVSFFAGINHYKYSWKSECYEDFADLGKKPRELQDLVLQFARAHNKRVFIGEASPAGIDIGQKTAACIFGYPSEEQRQKFTSQEIWDLWYEDFFRYIETNSDVIGAVGYINTNWDQQPNWRCSPASCSQGYWGDARIQVDEYILNRFKEELLKDHFVVNPKPSEVFVAPNLSKTTGVLEAEYASTPALWEAGDYRNGSGVPLAVQDGSRSNGGQYLIYANGGSLTFKEGLSSGNLLTIRYATVTEAPSFLVTIDGELVHEEIAHNTAGLVKDLTIPALVTPKSEIEIKLITGSLLFLDYIKIDTNIRVEYVNNTTVNLSVPALSFKPEKQLLCLGRRCRRGFLSNGRYERTVGGLRENAKYKISFKVETEAKKYTIYRRFLLNPNYIEGEPVFGINKDGTIFHMVGQQTGKWAKICVNSQCADATKVEDRWILKTKLKSKFVDLKFRIQDDEQKSCIVSASHFLVGSHATVSSCD